MVPLTAARLMAKLLPSADARLWLAYLVLTGTSLREVALAVLRRLRRWIMRRRSVEDVPVAAFSPTPFNARVAAAVLAAGGGAFRPSPLLGGPTVQCLLGVHGGLGGHRRTGAWRRELLSVPLPPLAPDGGRAVGLDWWSPGGSDCLDCLDCLDRSHVVLLLHGLAGDHHDMKASLAKACAARGWRTVCYVRRGYGGVPVGAGAGFPEHAEVADLAAVIADLAARPTTARLSAVGLSAGGNLLVRYLGSYAAAGPARHLAAAAAVSTAYDLGDVSRTLPWAMDQVLLAGLRRLLRAHLALLAGAGAGAGAASAPGLDRARLAADRAHSIRDFDERMHTSTPAAASVDDYYERNSSAHALERVGTPLLCLAALDDPCVLPAQTDRAVRASRTNPSLLVVTTRLGGHLGWRERDASWGVAAVVAFLEATGKA
jgi:predicted alpha/beta-fold hydrolase